MITHSFYSPMFSINACTQLVLSKQYGLWLVLISVRDVWKSAIATNGEQFVTMVLMQVMPGQHAAKLDIPENLLVSNSLWPI